jgi:hypothetical protein
MTLAWRKTRQSKTICCNSVACNGRAADSAESIQQSALIQQTGANYVTALVPVEAKWRMQSPVS